MSMLGFSKIINTKDAPVPVSPLGADSFYAKRSGAMAASTTETLIEMLKPSVIEVLEVSGSQGDVPQIRLYRRTPTGSFDNMIMIKSDGSGDLSMRPGELRTHGSSIFEIVTYDSSASAYKFVLSRPLAFPTGFRITIQNPTPSEKSVGAVIYGRTLS